MRTQSKEFMLLISKAALAGVFFITASIALATAPPAQVATIVVHGFDPEGASTTGIFGADKSTDYISDIATSIGLPLGHISPLAPNQVAYTTYYGDQYPSYYTSQDIADVEAITATHGGGVPRYATIIAKYAEEVMRRSGAAQINVLAVSFGGLISRYMIEKDIEGLASSGKIARWVCVEGVVAGNYAATHGGDQAQDFFENSYGGPAIDFQHMHYEWVEENLHNPRQSTDSPYYATFPTHFWLASDDNYNSRFLSYLSRKANDGVVLIEDGVLTDLPPQSLYQGLFPTTSVTHTHHESTKDHAGIRAGIAAQLFGRRRVTITLEQVRVRNEFDGGLRGNGEFVFGVKVFSPLAATAASIFEPIHDVRAQDASIAYVSMPQDTTQTVNLLWFDDMILPGETQLRLETNADEVDGDIIYAVSEDSDGSYEGLEDTTITVSTEVDAYYTVETPDWRGLVHVESSDYPPFEDAGPQTAAKDWTLYE